MSSSAAVSRRRFLVAGAVGAVGATLGSLPVQAGIEDRSRNSPSGPTSVARVLSTPAQTMQGFGASGAWWPNDLDSFDTGDALQPSLQPGLTCTCWWPP